MIYADETRRELLNWFKRNEVTDSLAYLHGHCQMYIVHITQKHATYCWTMKCTYAKITDFGLALMLTPNGIAEVAVLGAQHEQSSHKHDILIFHF